MRCSIADTTAAAEAPAGGAPSPPAAAICDRPEEQQQTAAAAAAAAAAQRQQQEAAADELQGQEQQRAADKQMQQRQQEELAAAAAATAAAEAERRAWQKTQRQLQQQAKEVLKRATQKQQHDQDVLALSASAARPAVTATQQAAAHHQQQGTGDAPGANSSTASSSGTLSAQAPTSRWWPWQSNSASPASTAGSTAAVGSASSCRQPAGEEQQPVPVRGHLPAIERVNFLEGMGTCLSNMARDWQSSRVCTPSLAQTKALLSSPHANNPAGWANQLWELCCIHVFYFCLVACSWAIGPPEGYSSSTRTLAVLFLLLLQLPVALLTLATAAVLLVCRFVVDMAWTWPILLATYLLPRLGAARVAAWLDSCVAFLAYTEEVWTAGVKLLLTAVSFATVRTVWTLVGGPWLLGWLPGLAGAAGWMADFVWTRLSFAWTMLVWRSGKPDSTWLQVLFAASTTGLCAMREHTPYSCGAGLTILQVLVAGNGLAASGSLASTVLLYIATSRWAAGCLPSSMRAVWWGVCVVLGSAPVLVFVWATHLGLWTLLQA